MKITTKSKYAILAILDIALYGDKTHTVNIADISKRQNISVHYLEQLLLKLRKANLLKSCKGPGGGYLLAQDIQQISIYQIIKTVNDDMDARTCHGMSNCNSQKKQCLAHNLWDGLTKHVYGYLNTITIADLVLQQQQQVHNISPIALTL